MFDRLPLDTPYYIYMLDDEKYVGRLSLKPDVNTIIYTWSKAQILKSLGNYHIDHISNIVIFKESGTTGLPNGLSPVFIGSEWHGVWNAVE